MTSPRRHKQPKTKRQSKPRFGEHVLRHGLPQAAGCVRLEKTVAKDNHDDAECTQDSQNAGKAEDPERDKCERGKDEKRCDLPL